MHSSCIPPSRFVDSTAFRRLVLAALLAGLPLTAPLAAQTDDTVIMQVPEPDLGVAALAQRRVTQEMELGETAVRSDFRFFDRLPETGITFVNQVTDDAGRDHKGVHYDHGNGLAVADVDGDGLLDLYFTTQLGDNELWRNRGDGRFENITEQAGVALGDRVGVTASFADIDNDGDPDLYVTTVKQGNALFENLGEGRFRDITEASGLGHVGHSSAAVFFDYNRDGRLDCYLTNVGLYTTDQLGRGGYYIGVSDAFSGHLYPERYEASLLFENVDGKSFKDVSQQVGLMDLGWTGDASPVDLNRDGWIDLYVLDMQGDDNYYENVGGERFVDKTAQYFPKTPWGAMGIKFFDYDNDGLMDLILSDMHSDMSEKVGPEREEHKSEIRYPRDYLQGPENNIFGNAFYRNLGDGRFEEVSDRVGVENYWPWGLSVGDVNADGFEDVFITASMNFPFRYGLNALLLNDAGDRFHNAELAMGIEPRRDGRTHTVWETMRCSGEDAAHSFCRGKRGTFVVLGTLGSRASAIVDIDGDGDLDIVTNEFGSEPQVFVSTLAQAAAQGGAPLRYLEVALTGSSSNRDGLGATVTVTAGDATYTKVHDGQSGYLSQSSTPLYFGLGDAGAVEKVEVLWPSGTRQTVSEGIAVGGRLEIAEPAGDG